MPPHPQQDWRQRLAQPLPHMETVAQLLVLACDWPLGCAGVRWPVEAASNPQARVWRGSLAVTHAAGNSLMMGNIFASGVGHSFLLRLQGAADEAEHRTHPGSQALRRPAPEPGAQSPPGCPQQQPASRKCGGDVEGLLMVPDTSVGLHLASASVCAGNTPPCPRF